METEALDRLKQARSRKSDVEQDLKEAYFFAAHWRPKGVLSETDTQKTRQQDTDSPATSLFSEVSGDFVAHIMDTFMPPFVDWARRGPGMMTRQQDWKRVEKQVDAADKQIMQAIRASGFGAAAYQAFNPDLYVGTCAMWLDPAQVSFHLPACWGVPIREFECNIGPLGTVDDRFVVKWVSYDHAKVILGPGASIPQEIANRSGGKKRCQLVLGFWQDYQSDGQVRWKHVKLLDRKLVEEVDLEGEGSCPLIPFRWEPDADQPWGVGPGIKTLPTARVIDALDAATQDRAEYGARPPYTYPNDGVINFDQGIEAGMGYPILPGSAEDIKELFFKGDINAGFYQIDQLERRVRRLAYVDFPEQPGKTPLSATQFLEDLVKAQKRIGPPGQMFWREGPREVFLRFKFILEAAGIVETVVRGDREGEVIALEAYNPAVRAQSVEQVENALKTAQVCYAIAPNEAALAIDGMKSIENVIDVLKEKILVLRDPAELQQAAGLMAQVMGGAAGMEAGAEAAGGAVNGSGMPLQ